MIVPLRADCAGLPELRLDVELVDRVHQARHVVTEAACRSYALVAVASMLNIVRTLRTQVKGLDPGFFCAHNARHMGAGKRRKPAGLRKEAHINIRLTEEQKSELTSAATRTGIGVSSWLLTVGLKEARKTNAETKG
jgi:mobilization protein NikA